MTAHLETIMPTPPPFAEVHPRTAQRDDLLIALAGSAWRLALAALYLSTGRYMPDAAKREGCSFGFCDADGHLMAEPNATHIGWTVGPVTASAPAAKES